MTESPDLTRLSEGQKDALIQALLAQLATAQEMTAALKTRVAELEAQLARLTRPPKTPDNSSKPPSQGQKPDRSKPDGKRPPRKSRPGAGC